MIGSQLANVNRIVSQSIKAGETSHTGRRMTRDELDTLLCDTYPDQVGFSVGDVIDVVLPLINGHGERDSQPV